MVRTNHTVETNASRGEGNQTAAERVADLLESDADDAFAKQEAAASEARTQWTPMNFKANMSHEFGAGSGPSLGPAVEGFGHVTVPDNHRVVGHTNPIPQETQVEWGVGTGPGSLTKDWRSEASRVGRYHKNPTFELRPQGTWAFKQEGGNAFNSRLNLYG